MDNKTDVKNSTQENPLTINRTFHASSKDVFNGFVDEAKLKQWWGPNDFTCPYFKTDARVGGSYLGCMRTPEGKDMWSTGEYIEIKAGEKLKYTDCFADEKGNVVPATYYDMSKDFPLECVVDLTFKEVDGKTQMTLKHFGIPASDIKDCTSGWGQCLDKLAKVVEGSSAEKRNSSARSSSSSANPIV